MNRKNLALTLGAATGVAQLDLSTAGAVVSLAVFVGIGSLAIAVAVGGYLIGGARADKMLDNMKEWLTVHNSAVVAVLLLVFGVDLIAKGIPPVT